MSTTTATVEVINAIKDLEAVLPGRVRSEPDGFGGAYVTVEDIELGPGWSRPSAPLTFHVPYNYPAAAIYPYYLPPDARPLNSSPPALQQVVWRGNPATQVSLRHTRWDPVRDNALGCVFQVRSWLRSQ